MQLLFIIKRFLALLVSHYRFFTFQYNWRSSNKHNQTTAANIFPTDSVKVGHFTYGPIIVYSWGSSGEFLLIGDFCSIASGVKFILGGNHKVNYLSSFPFKYFFNKNQLEAYSNGKIVINDDVWIGSDVTILSGVEIGQGSIIAAGSVVTKSFPPYSIIGGVPSKIIGTRFEKKVADILVNVDFSKFVDRGMAINLDLLYKDLSAMSTEEIKKYVKNLNIFNESKET